MYSKEFYANLTFFSTVGASIVVQNSKHDNRINDTFEGGHGWFVMKTTMTLQKCFGLNNIWWVKRFKYTLK